MEASTTFKQDLLLREYGRNVQDLVNHILSIEDKAERTRLSYLLINLMDAMPPQIEPYARIAEIIDADPERKRSARERYKQYRERGCTLESHNL